MLDEFKRIGCFLFQEGLVASHGGDLSTRQEDKIYITRRDSMLGGQRKVEAEAGRVKRGLASACDQLAISQYVAVP